VATARGWPAITGHQVWHLRLRGYQPEVELFSRQGGKQCGCWGAGGIASGGDINTNGSASGNGTALLRVEVRAAREGSGPRELLAWDSKPNQHAWEHARNDEIAHVPKRQASA
jgi:hypothetical protein